MKDKDENKSLHAVVVMRFVIKDVIDEKTLRDIGETFADYVTELIEEENIFGVAEDYPEIVSIQQKI